MRRLLVSALGALAFGWLSGGAQAQEPAQVLPRLAVGQAKGQETKAEALAQGPAGQLCGPNGCGQNGCFNWWCGDNGGGGTFIGGIGAYAIQPHFESNPAFGRSTSKSVGGVLTTTNTQNDFRQGWDVAPEGWIGYVNECGFGGRIRYFQYAQSSNESYTSAAADFAGGQVTTITTANPLGLGYVITPKIVGENFAFASQLNLLVWDLDIMQRWQVGSLDVNGFAGLRYAHTHQDYEAHFSKGGFTTIDNGNRDLVSSHNFNGFGPTLGLEGRRPVGNSGLALYANGRFTLLFGSTQESAFRSVYDPVTKALVSTAANSYHHTDVLPVGEGEIGVEFGTNVGNSARAIVQLGLNGQVWWGAGNASNTESIFTGGADSSSNLGFVGLVVRAGLSY